MEEPSGDGEREKPRLPGGGWQRDVAALSLYALDWTHYRSNVSYGDNLGAWCWSCFDLPLHAKRAASACDP